MYYAYFGMKLGNQDKSWALYIVCKTWNVHLHQWKNAKRNSLKIGVSMIYGMNCRIITMIVTPVHLI